MITSGMTNGAAIMPKLPGRVPEPVEGRVDYRRVDQGDRPAQKQVLVAISPEHARMGLVGGPIDLLGQELLVIGVDFLHVQRGQRLPLVGQ